jgi:hypothetical protein
MLEERCQPRRNVRRSGYQTHALHSARAISSIEIPLSHTPTHFRQLGSSNRRACDSSRPVEILQYLLEGVHIAVSV